MGLPHNLGRLSPAITSDASLNIGIGVTPSGTYKLDVNGTGNFSGALSGTSATFTGILTAGSSSSQTPASISTNNQANQPTLTLFKNIFTGTGEDVFRIQSFTSGIVNVFTVKDNGATTLAGALTGTSATFTAAVTPLILKSTSATTMWTEYYYNTSTLSGYIGSGSGVLSGANNSDFIIRSEADFVVATGGNNRRLTIASTGAATFSSSVTVGGSGTAIGNYLKVLGSTANNSNYPNIELVGGTEVNNYPFISLGNGGVGFTISTGYHTVNYPQRAQIAMDAVNYGISLRTSSSGSPIDRLIVTTGGNVGINTTSPQSGLGAGITIEGSTYSPLYLSNSGTLTGFLAGYSGGVLLSSSTGFISLNNGGGNVLIGTTTDAGFRLDVNGTGRFSGALTMSAYSFASSAIQFTRAATNTISPAGGNGILVFAGGNAQIRMDTANSINFDVNNSGNPFAALSIRQNGNTVSINSLDNGLPLELRYQNVASGYLGAAGSALYAYSTNGGYVFLNASSVWVPASDAKRKRNFETYSNGLASILGLQPKLYNMDFQEDGDEKQVGLIAQEVKQFIPKAYNENGDFIGLDYNAIIVTMVNAIKEQQAQIENLKLLIK